MGGFFSAFWRTAAGELTAEEKEIARLVNICEDLVKELEDNLESWREYAADSRNPYAARKDLDFYIRRFEISMQLHVDDFQRARMENPPNLGRMQREIGELTKMELNSEITNSELSRFMERKGR